LQNITTAINQINSNYSRVDWSSWRFKALEACLRLYLEMKFCKKDNDLKGQYAKLYSAVKDFDNNRVEYFDTYLDSNEDLIKMLYLHSKFPDGAENNPNEWFRPYIRNKIQRLTVGELRLLFDIHTIPKKYLEILKMFNPKQIPFDRLPIEITYGFDQTTNVIFIDSNGVEQSYDKKLDPVNVEHLSWNFQVPASKKQFVQEYLARFEPIPCSNANQHMDDDLPF